MCLYPRLIKNRKYLPNKKNKGVVPEMKDPRTAMVAVGCQKCIECIKQKERQWRIRLLEEIKGKTWKDMTMITLSFSEASLVKLEDAVREEADTELDGYELENEIATIAVRRFLERWRKEKGKSVRHWLTTELGTTNTERIHIHGIIMTGDKASIAKHWKYGNIWTGDYVNETTVSYLTKYVSKTDIKHKEYKPKILCSKGIGSGYTTRGDAKLNQYKTAGNTNTLYRNRQGYKMAMPMYYRNKIYSEEEREQLWIELLNKDERWVNGSRIRNVSTEEGQKQYYAQLTEERRLNARLGYGNDQVNWSRRQYEIQRRQLQTKKRNQKQWAIQNRNGKQGSHTSTPTREKP